MQLFSAAGRATPRDAVRKSGPALHRQAKQLPSAVLRFAAAAPLRFTVRAPSARRKGIAAKAAIGAVATSRDFQ
jgi:hypothetical protein